ncbi:metal ABC transporter permease [Quadrisphaera oryzae]|uniref:metal ABC transporter permease n=1 Tax=Quadrisphaera TaxID=317661 RepID=UPI0016468C95|nr:metal ABC transporter permease [Quadrisphaera sp. RL12-1S]
MFEPFMLNAWTAGTVVAVTAGVVGCFVVLRGESFLAHAVPHGAFAGAAGATLVGINPLLGLASFALVGSLTISLLGRRARSDVITALVLASMLALGALFLSRSTEYSSEVFALLFGQVLGVSDAEVLPMTVIAVLCIAVCATLFRPLLLASVLPAVAPSRGVRPGAVTVAFALLVAAATTTALPVVGALLMFALLVGPPAAARFVTARPLATVAVSVTLALVTVWTAIALSYWTDWPAGFFVTATSALLYAAARAASLPGHRWLPGLPGLRRGRATA